MNYKLNRNTVEIKIEKNEKIEDVLKYIYNLHNHLNKFPYRIINK